MNIRNLNFLRGMGSVFELFPRYPEETESPYKRLLSRTVEEAWKADAEALASDWQKVSTDFNQAVQKVGREQFPS